MVLERRSNTSPPPTQPPHSAALFPSSAPPAGAAAATVTHRRSPSAMHLPRFSGGAAAAAGGPSGRQGRSPRGYFAIILLALAVAYATSMSLSVFDGPPGGVALRSSSSGGGGGGDDAAGGVEGALQGFSHLMYGFYSAGHSMIMPRLMAAQQALFNRTGGGGADGGAASEWVEKNPESPGGGGDGEDSGPFTTAAAADEGEGEDGGAGEGGEGGEEDGDEEGGDEEEGEGEEEGGEDAAGGNSTAASAPGGEGAADASDASTSDARSGGEKAKAGASGSKSGGGGGGGKRRRRGGRRRRNARGGGKRSSGGKADGDADADADSGGAGGGVNGTSTSVGRTRRGRGGGRGDEPDGPVVSPILDPPDLAAERARYGGRTHPLGPLDVQILRDLSPWVRSGGFTLEDVLATRAQRAPLIDRVTNFSSGLITAVVKGNVVYMLESEIAGIIEQYGVGSKGKIRDFQAMMTAVARVYRLPDAWFLWNVHPWPLLRTRTGGAPPPSIETTRFASNSDSAVVTAPKGLAPVLSLCKTDGEIDVLYPNMYFQTPNYWWRVTQSIGKAADAWPWGKRKAKVWWRGASGWTWPASAPRVLTLARWHDKPWADLAFTSPWRAQLREWEKEKAPWRRSLPKSVTKIPGGPEQRTSMEAVARFKYALQLPGSYGATYSRTLQFLVWTGAAVFFYDCPYYEFYYHHLKPWEHYVPVNVTNLGDRVRWAGANGGKVERIAAASHRFARERLTAGHFALYWKQLLDLYAELQRFKVKLPDDACTCWPVARRSNPGASRPSWVPRGAKRCPFICDFGVHR